MLTNTHWANHVGQLILPAAESVCPGHSSSCKLYPHSFSYTLSALGILPAAEFILILSATFCLPWAFFQLKSVSALVTFASADFICPSHSSSCTLYALVIFPTAKLVCPSHSSNNIVHLPKTIFSPSHPSQCRVNLSYSFLQLQSFFEVTVSVLGTPSPYECCCTLWNWFKITYHKNQTSKALIKICVFHTHTHKKSLIFFFNPPPPTPPIYRLTN